MKPRNELSELDWIMAYQAASVNNYIQYDTCERGLQTDNHQQDDIHMILPILSPSPEQIVIFKETLQQLSKDAKKLISVATKEPVNFTADGKNKFSLCKLQGYMIKKGWTIRKYYAALNEVKNMLHELQW